jgi:hypothetical protein
MPDEENVPEGVNLGPQGPNLALGQGNPGLAQPGHEGNRSDGRKPAQPAHSGLGSDPGLLEWRPGGSASLEEESWPSRGGISQPSQGRHTGPAKGEGTDPVGGEDAGPAGACGQEA